MCGQIVSAPLNHLMSLNKFFWCLFVNIFLFLELIWMCSKHLMQSFLCQIGFSRSPFLPFGAADGGIGHYCATHSSVLSSESQRYLRLLTGGTPARSGRERVRSLAGCCMGSECMVGMSPPTPAGNIPNTAFISTTVFPSPERRDRRALWTSWRYFYILY